MTAFTLGRFLKRFPKTGRGAFGHDYDRREACCSGEWLHTWHMAPDHTERVVRHKLASAREATAAFRAWVAELEKAKYEALPKTDKGWTINPRGLRGYYNGNGTWGWPKKWSAGVTVEIVKGGVAKTTPGAAPPPPPKIDRAKLRKLARGGTFAKAATIETIIEVTNAWFAALVAAGLDLEPFAGADRNATAILTSGPYPAAALRGTKLAASHAKVLRSVGDLAVLADFRGRDTMFPIAKRRGWPVASTLAQATKVLEWEIVHHGERGSFTAAQLAARRWLRFAANAPGGSDHSFIMDLGTRGEPAIYRVDDIDLPTTITRRATVYGVRAWLVVGALHAVVAKTI